MADDDGTTETTPPTPVAEPVTSPPVNDNALRESVERLEQIVSGLAEQVASMAPAASEHERDESPTSIPWTHKRLS